MNIKNQEQAKGRIKEALSPAIERLQNDYQNVSQPVAEKMVEALVQLFAKHQDWKTERLVRTIAQTYKLKPNESRQIQGA